MGMVASYCLANQGMAKQQMREVNLHFREGMVIAKLIEASFPAIESNPALINCEKLEEAVSGLKWKIDELAKDDTFKIKISTDGEVREEGEVAREFGQ